MADLPISIPPVGTQFRLGPQQYSTREIGGHRVADCFTPDVAGDALSIADALLNIVSVASFVRELDAADVPMGASAAIVKRIGSANYTIVFGDTQRIIYEGDGVTSGTQFYAADY